MIRNTVFMSIIVSITFTPALFLVAGPGTSVIADDIVVVGLNYPRTGPYFTQGLDQYRAATMAIDEINAAGGILGMSVKLVWRDSKSEPELSRDNITELIDKEGAQMIFGGSSSSVAVVAGDVCQQKGRIFFATLSYSTATTGTEGHRHTFRECYDSWMSANALARYLNDNFAGKKYFYVTANYTWGWTTEESLRQLTGTTDKTRHQTALTQFPDATADDFKKALAQARLQSPDVLVLVLFGSDMINGVNIASAWGFKEKMQIVVPNITLGMAEGSGPLVMHGVIGAVPWSWKIPYIYNYPRGKQFVEAFTAKYNRYPSTSGASAYTVLYEYKAAVERAGTFDTARVIKALEGHEYTFLKDKQVWRAFDHQSVQTVYAVRCNPPDIVVKDKLKLDYFDIITSLAGESAAISHEQWKATRAAADKSTTLEKLPGE